MHKTFRGAARFSLFGFTYARMASRLCLSAPSDISAQTGLRSKSIFVFCFFVIRIPEFFILPRPHTANGRARTVARERQQHELRIERLHAEGRRGGYGG